MVGMNYKREKVLGGGNYGRAEVHGCGVGIDMGLRLEKEGGDFVIVFWFTVCGWVADLQPLFPSHGRSKEKHGAHLPFLL